MTLREQSSHKVLLGFSKLWLKKIRIITCYSFCEEACHNKTPNLFRSKDEVKSQNWPYTEASAGLILHFYEPSVVK